MDPREQLHNSFVSAALYGKSSLRLQWRTGHFSRVIKSLQLFFLARLIDHEETWNIYKWKWMVLGALGCINNADFGGKNSK